VSVSLSFRDLTFINRIFNKLKLWHGFIDERQPVSRYSRSNIRWNCKLFILNHLRIGFCLQHYLSMYILFLN
jgi:hypothetical protein